MFAPAARRPSPSMTPVCRGECPVRSAHGSNTNSRVAHQEGQHGRERGQIDLLIDEMVAAGKSWRDILTAVVALSRFSLHECKFYLRGYDSGRAWCCVFSLAFPRP